MAFKTDINSLPPTPHRSWPRRSRQTSTACPSPPPSQELAKAFKTDINSLPLSLDISWFEQKAVSVLLTLLSLGVKNIRLGPVLPAFLTAEAVQVCNGCRGGGGRCC